MFEDRDDPKKYRLGGRLRNPPVNTPGFLYAPVHNRTTAHYESHDAYIFWSSGGLSWGAPFIAGVAALGIQQNPNLTPRQITEQLQVTGTQFKDGKMINPKKFVETVAALGS